MTEEKPRGNRLKNALGLENLKGLGDTLKQIKDVKDSLDGVSELVGEVAKDNSPLGKALARLVEAQGLVTLNEGNVTVSEEVRRTMADEIKDQEKKVEGLEAENRGLKEDRVITEITGRVTEELDRRLPQSGGGGGNDSGQGKLFKAIEDVIADKLQRLLGGGDGEGTLTGDQIRSIIKEEVGQVAGGIKKPEDMVDSLMTALTVGDRLREKLGVAGVGGRLIQGQGGDTGVRTDLVKLLLEDERERLKITQDHEASTQRNQHLGTIAGAVKDNLSDGIAALKMAAEEAGRSTESNPPSASTDEQPAQVFACGDCQTQFTFPPGWTGQPIKCACGRIYTKEELQA